MKRLYFYISAVIAAFCVCVYVYADEIGELKKQRDGVRSEINTAGGLLKEVVSEKNTALSEIDALDDELTAVTDDLSFIGEQLVITEAELAETEVELANATEKRESQYAAFKQRVRYQYINGTVGYLDVILKAEDVTDLLNRVEYVNRIVESDKNMAARLTETEDLIAEKLDDINVTKREMELLSAQYEEKHEQLEDAKYRKVVLVERLSANEAMYKQQIDDLSKDDKRIENLIKEAEAKEAKRIAEEKARAAAQAAAAKAKASVASYQGGKVGWPVPSSGQISSGYGNRMSPINGKPEFHTGIDIPAPYGSSIVAAEGGTVLSAGWNGGYGNTVVISHGGGLSTLYAHSSKLLVSVGEVVKKGQVVALVGSTGYSTGNHLHFEVRVNGAHTNPAPYLKG